MTKIFQLRFHKFWHVTSYDRIWVIPVNSL